MVNGKTPYVVWPMVSLFVLALVFFASPGSLFGTAPTDASSEPTEVDVTGSTPG